MNKNNLNNIDEKLTKATTQMVVDLVIKSNASSDEIKSGKFRPLNRTIHLINIEKILQKQNAQAIPIESNS